jgi:hypothetical protein
MMRLLKVMFLSGMLLQVRGLCAQKDSRVLKTEKRYAYSKIEDGPLSLLTYSCDSFSTVGVLQTSVSFDGYYGPRYDTVYVFNSPGEQRRVHIERQDERIDTFIFTQRFDNEGRMIYQETNSSGSIASIKYLYDKKGKLIFKEEIGPHPS